MSFCTKCGTQLNDGACFCSACGTPLNGQNAQPQMQFQQSVYVYTKPKVPGRGLGIAGMVLGIIGLFYSVVMLMAVIAALKTMNLYDYEAFSVNIPLIFMILLYSSLSILGVSLAGCAKRKGYRTGISTAGVVTGIIGIVFYCFAILLSLIV